MKKKDSMQSLGHEDLELETFDESDFLQGDSDDDIIELRDIVELPNETLEESDLSGLDESFVQGGLDRDFAEMANELEEGAGDLDESLNDLVKEGPGSPDQGEDGSFGGDDLDSFGDLDQEFSFLFEEESASDGEPSAAGADVAMEDLAPVELELEASGFETDVAQEEDDSDFPDLEGLDDLDQSLEELLGETDAMADLEDAGSPEAVTEELPDAEEGGDFLFRKAESLKEDTAGPEEPPPERQRRAKTDGVGPTVAATAMETTAAAAFTAVTGAPGVDATHLDEILDRMEERLLGTIHRIVEEKLPDIVRSVLREEIEKVRRG